MFLQVRHTAFELNYVFFNILYVDLCKIMHIVMVVEWAYVSQSLKVLFKGKMEELQQSETVKAGSLLCFVSRQYSASKKNVWLFC